MTKSYCLKYKRYIENKNPNVSRTIISRAII